MRRTPALVLAMLGLAAAIPPANAGPRGDVATALADPTRLPRRAHVAHAGRIGLTAETTVADADADADAQLDDVPVVAVTGARVRLVIDDDGARLLLWVDAADLAWAITREVRVAGKGDVGVWLLSGARVTASGTGARRRVIAAITSADPVEVRGVVPATALGKVFTVAPPPPATPPGQHAPAILDAPDGAPLLTTPDGLNVRVVAAGGGDWRLVEHHGAGLRVRGWARLRDLEDGWLTLGSGVGRAYGISDTARVTVAAGTCFHAAAAGPVVGVQLADSVRYAHGPERGWWPVYVGTAWGLFTVMAQQTGTDAAGEPVFARCR